MPTQTILVAVILVGALAHLAWRAWIWWQSERAGCGSCPNCGAKPAGTVSLEQLAESRPPRRGR